MRRIRIMGLSLIAVFALGAVVAGNAFALPEVGRCVSKAGGKYTEAACLTKASGTKPKLYEWEKNAVKIGFTATGGEGVLETKAGTKVVCTAQSAKGDYLAKGATPSTKEVNKVVATFTGCTLPVISASCNTKGDPSGTIITDALKGPMGYVSGEKTKTPVIGQELTPETKKGAFAEFECGAGAVKIVVKEGPGKGGNCVISPLSEVNVMSTTVGETYSGSAGVQNPQHFQKTPTKICNLESAANGGTPERATQGLETTITNEEALEVKA